MVGREQLPAHDRSIPSWIGVLNSPRSVPKQVNVHLKTVRIFKAISVEFISYIKSGELNSDFKSYKIESRPSGIVSKGIQTTLPS